MLLHHTNLHAVLFCTEPRLFFTNLQTKLIDAMRRTIGRFYSWVASWQVSARRKGSTSSVGPSSSSNCSNFSYENTTSALRGKLTSSNIKKVVRFAEDGGKVLAQVMNNNEERLDEALEEVYIKDGLIRGFIKVRNLEPGRQVIVRYTDNNWKGFKQVQAQHIERIIDSKGKGQIRHVKVKNGKLSRRLKQVNPCVGTKSETHEMTYYFKMKVEQSKLNQVELVIISSFNNVIDTNHQHCYTLKPLRCSWEVNGTSQHWDVNRSSSPRQS